MLRPTRPCLFLTGCLLFSSCTSAILEFDRMAGTAFPNPETVGADTFDLPSIYEAGDIELTVSEDDTNIVPLVAGADFITDAEVDAAVLAFRDMPVGVTETDLWLGTNELYHVYGIIVDYDRELADGTQDTSTIARMYDPDLRSGFVSYYSHSYSQSNDTHLRTTAHEVGHAFNLNHEDGDYATTIMTRSSDLDWVNGWGYSFSAASLDHLQNHDPSAVWPGIGPRHYTDHSQHYP